MPPVMSKGSTSGKSIKALPDIESPLEKDGIVSVSNTEANMAREAALVRRIDLNIIPIMMTLYLFSFLDRGKSLHARRHDFTRVR